MVSGKIKIGRWDVPTKLFERYVRLIDATERSSERYDYEFDKERESIHHEIMEHAGILPHMRDDRELYNHSPILQSTPHNNLLSERCQASCPTSAST